MEEVVYQEVIKLLKKLPEEEIIYREFNGRREVRIEFKDQNFIRISIDKNFLEQEEYLEISGSYGELKIKPLKKTQLNELNFYFDAIKAKCEDQLYTKLVSLNNGRSL